MVVSKRNKTTSELRNGGIKINQLQKLKSLGDVLTENRKCYIEIWKGIGTVKKKTNKTFSQVEQSS